MFSLTRPSDDEIDSFLSRQPGSSFSYREVGATASSPPRQYNIDRTRVRLGQGDAVWSRAVEAVQAWRMFDIPWLRLCWPTAPIRAGTDVALLVRHFGFWSLNGCRIVYVVEDEWPSGRRYGFAYGTLGDHAERGEERFTVEWNLEDDAVWYDILAFSRPKEFLARLASPLSRLLQRRFAAASKSAGSPPPARSRPLKNRATGGVVYKVTFSAWAKRRIMSSSFRTVFWSAAYRLWTKVGLRELGHLHECFPAQTDGGV